MQKKWEITMEICKEEKTPGILRDEGEDWVTMWISRVVMKANLFEFRPAESPSSQSMMKLSVIGEQVLAMWHF